jgi:hypothetical protein
MTDPHSIMAFVPAADNFMMAMHVDDAQEWVDRAEALVERFPGARTIAPVTDESEDEDDN